MRKDIPLNERIDRLDKYRDLFRKIKYEVSDEFLESSIKKVPIGETAEGIMQYEYIYTDPDYEIAKYVIRQGLEYIIAKIEDD